MTTTPDPTATGPWSARPSPIRAQTGRVWWLLHDGLETGSIAVLHPLHTPETTIRRVLAALNADGEVPAPRPELPGPLSRWRSRHSFDEVLVIGAEIEGDAARVVYASVDERGVSPWTSERSLEEFHSRFVAVR